MPDMTTRRALEICMARVLMNKHSMADLACALSAEIRADSGEYRGDAVTLHAALEAVIDELNVASDYSKRALLGRIDTAVKLCKSAIQSVK